MNAFMELKFEKSIICDVWPTRVMNHMQQPHCRQVLIIAEVETGYHRSHQAILYAMLLVIHFQRFLSSPDIY
jgi:hypothetical protein